MSNHNLASQKNKKIKKKYQMAQFRKRQTSGGVSGVSVSPELAS